MWEGHASPRQELLMEMAVARLTLDWVHGDLEVFRDRFEVRDEALLLGNDHRDNVLAIPTWQEIVLRRIEELLSQCFDELVGGLPCDRLRFEVSSSVEYCVPRQPARFAELYKDLVHGVEV